MNSIARARGYEFVFRLPDLSQSITMRLSEFATTAATIDVSTHEFCANQLCLFWVYFETDYQARLFIPSISGRQTLAPRLRRHLVLGDQERRVYQSAQRSHHHSARTESDGGRGQGQHATGGRGAVAQDTVHV